MESSKHLRITKNRLLFSVTTAAFGYIQDCKNLLYLSVAIEEITIIIQLTQEYLLP